MPYFLSHEVSERFMKTYKKSGKPLQNQVDKAIRLLIDNPKHPSLKTHSIKNANYYKEAYINAGDRLIYRPEGNHLKIVDMVSHDDIKKYG